MEATILRYLRDKYHPLAIIIYGSFADGSSGPGSDFDALLIAAGEKRHDDSSFKGVPLDVFLYPPEQFQKDWDPADYIQICGGRIVEDRGGLAEGLMERVNAYVAQLPRKSLAELREELNWCRKMLARALRDDDEGFYRWHWLLTDSLEIFCDLVREPWLGPKKALKLMAASYGVALRVYRRALREMTPEALRNWIDYLDDLAKLEAARELPEKTEESGNMTAF